MGLGPEGLATAFAVGLVAFVSPCVLPLIPGYLSFASGVGFDELGSSQGRVVASTSAFVVGLGAMFAALGAGAGWFGSVWVRKLGSAWKSPHCGQRIRVLAPYTPPPR